MKNDGPREAMSSVDKAWLRMDRPTNLMIINGVMLFDELIDFAHLKAVLEHRLVGKYSRFRQRLIVSPARSDQYYWEDDPYFDLRSHIRRVALPAPGDPAMLQSLISDLMSGALDRDKPLWCFYLIENVGNGCAIFARFHHCIADGVALVQVMLAMTDTKANAPWPEPGPMRPRARQGAVATMLGNLRKARATTTGVVNGILHEGTQVIDNPAYGLEMAKSASIITAASAAILGKLLLIAPDRASVLNGELGVAKRIIWSDPLDLNQVKAIGRTTGATVNDVLVAAIAGGLRQYLQTHGDPVDQADLRVMVPVNLRPLDEEPQLGNHFSLVYLSLPISLADPLARLEAVKRRMNLLKNSTEPLLIYQLLGLVGMLPIELANYAIRLFASKATGVLTNVFGPSQTLYFAGKPLRRLMFWVPQSGQIGLGISIISYAGTVTVGFVVDEKLASDLDAMLGGFYAGFAELAQLVAPQATSSG